MLLASTNQHKAGCTLDNGEKCLVGKGIPHMFCESVSEFGGAVLESRDCF